MLLFVVSCLPFQYKTTDMKSVRPHKGESRVKGGSAQNRFRYHFEEMRRPFLLIILIILSTMALADKDYPSICCSRVVNYCRGDSNIPQCIEKQMRNCSRICTRAKNPNLYLMTVKSSSMARVNTEYGHIIHIPSEAVQKSNGGQQNHSSVVDLTVSVLNHSLFETTSKQGSTHEHVLGVWLGREDVYNLSHPVKMVFVNASQNGRGTCVFWNLPKSTDTDNWNTDGCKTTKNNTDIICECNHLSFFAVLIGSNVPDQENIERLEYISYIGSSFSVAFTIITIVMFLCQRKTKLEHSSVIHMQLTGSLFLLHLFFLASTFLSKAEKPVCQPLGMSLHLALLATFTWTAIEGFHLYLLLVRVFNIYIRRYLIKLSLVGWGVPTVVVIICGVTGTYGKYSLTEDTSNTTTLCWVTTKAVRYITVTGYLGLVQLFNIIILAVMVMKMRQLRMRSVQIENKVKRFWKDWATVVGLSCVLGIPWGLAFTTHGPLSLPGIYLFTILNGFQGVLMFLWFFSITCKSKHEEQQSTKDLSMSKLNT